MKKGFLTTKMPLTCDERMIISKAISEWSKGRGTDDLSGRLQCASDQFTNRDIRKIIVALKSVLARIRKSGGDRYSRFSLDEIEKVQRKVENQSKVFQATGVA